MNKTAIKNFAIWARNKLIADIVFQAGLLGITEKGIASALPQSTREVQFFDIGTKDYITVRGNAIRQRDAFVAAINAKKTDTDYISAFRFVVEKIAYTWFNRLIAIRFMEVNDYLPSRVRVLSSENPSKAEPDMVTRPFDTDMSFSIQERDEIMRMKDENKLDELFRMLFIKQCQKLSEVLPGLFAAQSIERPDSYLELLLTISFTDKDGVLWHLVNDIEEKYFRVRTPEDDERQQENNIPEEEMPAGQVEIIGWMYQYYNTEPKDKVFANLKKNIKIKKDDIPAATQLFTPDWIVRYLVENSLGRLWVEGHPNEGMRKKWKYYLEEAEQEPKVQEKLVEIRKEYTVLSPETLKTIDPCMGSGHILIYLFDILMQIYESQGWTQREAAQSIVKNNLYGLDIDDRAAQLAYFAVMMKARQYDRRFLERGIMPHVYGIQESNDISREQIKLFGKNMSTLEKNNAMNQLNTMLDLLHDAKEYGSILSIPDLDWETLYRYTQAVDGLEQIEFSSIGVDDTLMKVRQLVDQAHIMAQKYDIVVTNPPYMGSNGMGQQLSQFIKDYYPDSKNDLFAVFMERCQEMTKAAGFQAMITQHAWMFLSGYEKLREKLQNVDIVNMAHLGARAFEEIGGEVVQTTSFVMRTTSIIGYLGTYFRLVEPTTQQGKEDMFLSGEGRYVASQKNFINIPGSPIAYWVSIDIMRAFNHPKLDSIAFSDGQILTGDNEKYLRVIWEVNYEEIGKDKSWMIHAKGGEYRKWSGNIEWVVNWTPAAIDHYKKDKIARFPKPSVLYRKGVTWNLVSTSPVFGARILTEDQSFNKAAATLLFYDDALVYYVLAFLNSKVADAMSKIINPTLNTNIKDILALPYILDGNSYDVVTKLAKKNIAISDEDWNEFETSMGFKTHPFIRIANDIRLRQSGNSVLENMARQSSSRGCLLDLCYKQWERECINRFEQLKTNEEEINGIFIEIYHLQNELSLMVDEKDVTTYKANVSRDVRSLISYAVGCMFGRFSLDHEGIAFAGGEWNSEKYHNFIPDPDNCIPITDEEYFEDDIVGRFVEFIRIVFGTDTLDENLDFIAKALGNKGNASREVIRNYFLNDFYKDHCSFYSVTGSGKRPIYWLFDSGKQHGFKALVYMHRWNADTVGNLRVEYLHRMQRVYESEIERMQDIIDNSKDNREISQANKRREKLVKQLKEARDYDAQIAHVALSRITIDLDDGVKVNYEKVQKGSDGKNLGILAKL